jgi:hypothetical protein
VIANGLEVLCHCVFELGGVPCSWHSLQSQARLHEEVLNVGVPTLPIRFDAARSVSTRLKIRRNLCKRTLDESCTGHLRSLYKPASGLRFRDLQRNRAI